MFLIFGKLHFSIFLVSIIKKDTVSIFFGALLPVASTGISSYLSKLIPDLTDVNNSLERKWLPNYNKDLPYIDVHAAVTWQCLSKFILITKTKPNILILHISMLCNYVKVFALRASG